MAKLIYSAISSLDGYVADEEGGFDWAAPDEEVHAFVNDLERPIGTYLYGRRMCEVMVAWETMPTTDDQSAVTRDYAAIWRAADKVVYSRPLGSVASARTRIEREFDPDAVRRLKERSERDISVGGPTSPRRRSRPGWSTSAICSSTRSSSAAARGRCRTVSGSTRPARRAPLRQRRRAPALPGAPLSLGAVESARVGLAGGHQ